MASASSSEKVWHQDILDDSDIGNVDGLKGLWIYCQVCAKKINMKYPFRGSRWNEHAKAVSHLEAKAKQKHQKAGESSPLKQSSMMSFMAHGCTSSSSSPSSTAVSKEGLQGRDR